MLLRRSSAAQMRSGRCQQCVAERMQLPRSKAIRPRSRWASLAAALLTSRPYDPAAEWELPGLCRAIPSSPYSLPTVAQTHTAEPCAGHDDKQSGVSPPTGQRIYRRSHAHSSAASRAAAHDELSAQHHDLLTRLWQVRHTGGYLRDESPDRAQSWQDVDFGIAGVCGDRLPERRAAAAAIQRQPRPETGVVG